MRNNRLFSTLFHLAPYQPRHRHRSRRGSAMLEFAMVLGLLMAIILGVVEFSAYGKNALAIANASREGARAAAIGRTTAQIRDRVARSASPLSVTSPVGSIALDYSTDGGVHYQTLTDNAAGTGNAASPDDLIKVTVNSFNRSLTGAFGLVLNRNLHTEVIMRRER